MVFALLCLASSTQYNVFQAQPCCSMGRISLVVRGLGFHGMTIPRSVYLFICQWTPGLFAP